MSRASAALFSTLFFLSGMAGLIYEVCWTRLLRLPLGNTLHSMTAVLTAFMAGLALGAWLAGRWIDRRGHPLRVYAALEAAIGIVCFALPWLIAAQEPLFRWAYRASDNAAMPFHLLRFVACALVVLLPATLMGATLPVLCRYFIDRSGRLGAAVGWLYAVNAFGAAIGSLLAGFVLVPQLGLRGAMWTGVATSLVVAGIAWMAQRGTPARVAESASRGREIGRAATQDSVQVEPTTERARRTIFFGYGLSGLAAMVLQIAWARALALLLGSSVYAFALLVSAFVLGLSVGSAIASRFADRVRRPGLAFAAAEIGIGLTALAMVPVFQRYPEWMLQLVPRVAQDFSRFQLAQFGLVFATLLLPTACMGACLPLVGRTLARAMDRAAETVGSAYSINAAGTIAGAFLGGFVLLPELGMHRAILVAAAVNLLVGAAVLWTLLPGRRALAAAAGVVVVAAGAIALVPPFDAATVTSGMYLYAGRMASEIEPGTDLRQRLNDDAQILLHREGANVTVTVHETTSGQRILALNGKSDASDGGDMPTQQLLAHVPCLLHPAPRDVAVVGLASGVTVHSVGLHPTVRAIDCIEIAPEVVEACRLFEHVNGGVLADPRLQLIFQDARNHMMLTDQEYDVIISEPSNPWIAGIASLFTREFLQACHERLRPGGVLCQWVQLYGLDEQTFRSVARTFQDVFPQATLWEAEFAADFLLVGRKPGASASEPATWRERMAPAAMAADMARMGVREPADLWVRNVTDAGGLKRFAATGEVYNDDHNRLEFTAPRLMHQVTSMATLRTIQGLRQAEWRRELGQEAVMGAAPERLQAAHSAQRRFFAGVERMAAQDAGAASEHFIGAIEQYPGTPGAWRHLLQATRQVVAMQVARGDTAAARALYRRQLALAPEVADLYSDAGLFFATQNDLGAAIGAYRRALELRPRSLLARINLATALILSGDAQGAESELRRALDQRPDHLRARLALGNVLLQSGDARAAEGEYRRAVESHPDDAQPWFLLGEALRRQGSNAQALSAYAAALQRDPDHRAARTAHDLLMHAN